MAVLGAVLMLAATPAIAAAALTTTCVGTPTPTSITWAATSTGGVTPITYLWGNGSTLASQTVTALPGSHSMTVHVTDASSTIAVATCSATVSATSPTPTSTNPVLEAKIKSIRAQILALTQELKTLLRQQRAEIASSTPPTNAACDQGLRKYFKKLGFKEVCKDVGRGGEKSHGQGRNSDDD